MSTTNPTLKTFFKQFSELGHHRIIFLGWLGPESTNKNATPSQKKMMLRFAQKKPWLLALNSLIKGLCRLFFLSSVFIIFLVWILFDPLVNVYITMENHHFIALFLWPFSMSQTVSLPGRVDAKNPTIWDAWGHHPVERSLLGHREELPFVRPFVAGLYPGGQRRASRCQVQAPLGRGNITWNDSHVYTQNITKLRAVPETYSDRQPKWVS